jgi:hypothetical protein
MPHSKSHHARRVSRSGTLTKIVLAENKIIFLMSSLKIPFADVSYFVIVINVQSGRLDFTTVIATMSGKGPFEQLKIMGFSISIDAD